MPQGRKKASQGLFCTWLGKVCTQAFLKSDVSKFFSKQTGLTKIFHIENTFFQVYFFTLG